VRWFCSGANADRETAGAKDINLAVKENRFQMSVLSSQLAVLSSQLGGWNQDGSVEILPVNVVKLPQSASDILAVNY